MKMSDVFDLPVDDNDVGVWGGVWHAISTCDKAAAHAINCHDELVEALEHCLENIKGTPLAAKLNRVLKKERGES